MATISMQSSRFGKVEVDETDLLSINGGILGFPNSDRFVVLDHEQDSPFKWLQSIEEPEIAFAITDPQAFFPDYHIQIKREEIASLDVRDGDELMIFVILSLKAAPQDMTANLQGPIIVNIRSRKGRQIVLKGTKYMTRHPLFPLLQPENQENKEKTT